MLIIKIILQDLIEKYYIRFSYSNCFYYLICVLIIHIMSNWERLMGNIPKPVLFPPWVSPTQATQEEEKDEWDHDVLSLPSPQDELITPLNHMDRFYVRNPHSSFPPFVS